jgi:uncharacterized protein (TIGR03067 family)
MKTAQFILAMTVACTALSASWAGGGDPKDALQGIWVADYVEKDEISIPPALAGLRFTFKGDKLLVSQRGGKDKEHAYRLDTSKSPKYFDIVPPGEKTVLGIYEVKGNELSLCVRYGNGGRPTEFGSKADSGLVYLVFKKQK